MQNSAAKPCFLAYFHERDSKFYSLACCYTKYTQDENLSKDFRAEFREAKFYHCEKFQPLIVGVCGVINSKLELQAGSLLNFKYFNRRKTRNLQNRFMKFRSAAR